MQSTHDFMLNRILLKYSELENSQTRYAQWNNMSEEELWHHLCLCILSSSVVYELAYSAFLNLRTRNLLSKEHLLKSSTAVQELSNALSESIFHPRKRNGMLRKYRFPRRRSQDITRSAKMLYSNGNGLIDLLSCSKSDADLRDHLANNLAGVGLKQASHFLRNIGYSDSLAIIDTHILKFLNETQGLKIEENSAITKRQYHNLEDVLREMCDLMELNLGIFDSAIWHYMRGK